MAIQRNGDSASGLGDVASLIGVAAVAAGFMYSNVSSEAEIQFTFNQAISYAQQGNYNQSIQLLHEVLKRNPSHAPTYNFLAWIYTIHRYQLDQALEFANRAVSLASNPSEREHFSQTLAAVYLSIGDWYTALRVNYRFVFLTLIQYLSDKDEKIRLASVNALGQIRDEEAVPALCKVLAQDPHPEVRRSAAEALGMIGSQETGAGASGNQKS